MLKTTFADLDRQPRRFLNSPIWSGLVTDGRAYSGFCLNVEHLVPWRTLTGRQHFYLDHQGYLAAGEHLPTYKPKPDHSTAPGLFGHRVGRKEHHAQLPDTTWQVEYP